MKILYLDIHADTPNSKKYRYYENIYTELKKDNDITLVRGVTDIKNFCLSNNYKPDLVLFGLGFFSAGYYGSVNNIDVPTACVIFKPQDKLKEKLNFCMINGVDLILTPNHQYREYSKLTGIRAELIPYGFEPEYFYNRGSFKEYDIGFSGALHDSKHYPPGAFPVENIRGEIGKILNRREDLRLFWSAKDGTPSRIPSYDDYAATVGKSKIWIATQAPFGDITPRVLEIAGSNTLVFCQKLHENYSHIFKHGHNCVEFENDLSDFEEKLDYYLNNEAELNRITKNGFDHVHKNYTCAKMATRMMEEIKKISR